MRELNKETLTEALQQLPSYEPEEQAWTNILQGLSDVPLKETIAEMQDHDPPDSVWDRIETDLQKPARIRTLFTRGWAAAAGLAILISAAWFLGQNLDGGTPLEATISYSVEVVDETILQLDWNEDEKDFVVLEDICSQHPFLCNRPDIQALRSELADLTSAKGEIVQVLGPYGTDINLIEKLTDIEMERTKLLKQILIQVI